MHTIEVQGGYTKGGYEFNILTTPCSESYPIVSISEFKIGNDTYWHGYIKAKTIKEKKFPLDANPRKPGPTKVVRIMQATAQKEPKNFHHLNNGITIIAKSLIYDKINNLITLEFGETIGIHGDGICNGGHTYFSIDQFQGNLSDEMLVKIEILVLDPNLNLTERSDKIKIIAEARNAHNELESITTAHYSGYYDNIINALKANKIYFKWYEGDPDAVKNAEKVDSLIAKITAISPHWYSHHLNQSGNMGNHMSSARNTGSIHKKWESFKLTDDERNLDYILPLINDVLLLIDEINFSLANDNFPKVSKHWKKTKIWKYLGDKAKATIELNFKEINGSKVNGYNLSHTFITMILGAFRENVWFSMSDNGVNYVGWLIEPISLWHKHKEVFMRDLNNIASTINAPSFGNAFLQNPAIYNYQLTTKHFGINIADNIDKPEVFYDISSNIKYTIDNTRQEPHFLECELLDPELPPIAEITSIQNQTFACYKKHL
jgi:hypothetical protein